MDQNQQSEIQQTETQQTEAQTQQTQAPELGATIQNSNFIAVVMMTWAAIMNF